MVGSFFFVATGKIWHDHDTFNVYLPVAAHRKKMDARYLEMANRYSGLPGMRHLFLNCVRVLTRLLLNYKIDL